MLYQTVPLSLRVQTAAATKQESGASISVSAPGRERLLQHTRPTSKMPKFCYGCVPHQGSSQPVAPQQDNNFHLSHMQLKKLPVIPHYYNYPLQRKKIFLHKLFLCSQHPFHLNTSSTCPPAGFCTVVLRTHLTWNQPTLWRGAVAVTSTHQKHEHLAAINQRLSFCSPFALCKPCTVPKLKMGS